jgi:hypothetical protein
VEETGAERVTSQTGTAVGRNDIGQFAGFQIRPGNVLGEFAVVVGDVVGERVGQDLVHVDGDARF